jgi:hypothetical protein
VKNYNNDYFIVFAEKEENKMRVDIHDKSMQRRYLGVQLEFNEPLFFEPGFQELLAKKNITSVKADVMFSGASFIMNNKVREAIKQFDLHGMQLYPAILVEEDENWDESYWYLNIWERLDCWDRDKSIYDPIEEDEEESDTTIDRYYLDAEVLDKIPEEQRLIFRMGGEAGGEILFHESLVNIFRKNKFTGMRFFKVSEFEEGDQF